MTCSSSQCNATYGYGVLLQGMTSCMHTQFVYAIDSLIQPCWQHGNSTGERWAANTHQIRIWRRHFADVSETLRSCTQFLGLRSLMAKLACRWNSMDQHWPPPRTGICEVLPAQCSTLEGSGGGGRGLGIWCLAQVHADRHVEGRDLMFSVQG